MKKTVRILAVLLVCILSVTIFIGCGSKKVDNSSLDLNSMSVSEIERKAREEGEIASVGMPDDWANWKDTWEQITEIYGLRHSDVDMSSAEELALFEAEKNAPTKDIGDVGISFGPLAKSRGLTLPYKTTYWDEIPAWAKDDEGHWLLAYTGTISIMSNLDLVDKAPRSFQDILDGDYMVTMGDAGRATQSQCALLSAAFAFGGDETNIDPGLQFFRTLAEAGRIDIGENSIARLEKGEIAVSFYWDFNSLGYRSTFVENNPNANFAIHIPSDGAVMSGYTTIINAYAPRPHAAALAREYILSDQGQINLAVGFARPIRTSVDFPDDVKAKMLPNDEYLNTSPIRDQSAWEATVETMSQRWQDEVLAHVK